MRKSTFVIILSLLSFTFIMAQGGPPQGRGGQRQSPEEMAKNRADTFQEQFGLSDEQRDKTEAALLVSAEDSMEKMTALREEMSQSGNREGAREKMTTIMDENREKLEKELKKIFTEQQYAAYEKWLEENPPQQRRRRGGGE